MIYSWSTSAIEGCDLFLNQRYNDLYYVRGGCIFFCKKILRICYIYEFFFILKTNLSVFVYIYLDKDSGVL